RRLIAGICIGYAIVQTLCTLLLCGLAQLFLPMLEVLKYIGGIYMVWLAIHIMRSRYSDSETNNKPSFHLGLLLQLVNVKIYFYLSTLLTAYFIPNCKSVCSLALAGIFTVSIGSIACLTWAFLGAKLQSFYKKHFRCVNIVLGVFLLYCAVTIIPG
ncbi:MAG: LysE family transporter, partial [Oscillospiraceae bacterium]